MDPIFGKPVLTEPVVPAQAAKPPVTPPALPPTAAADAMAREEAAAKAKAEAEAKAKAEAEAKAKAEAEAKAKAEAEAKAKAEAEAEAKAKAEAEAKAKAEAEAKAKAEAEAKAKAEAEAKAKAEAEENARAEAEAEAKAKAEAEAKAKAEAEAKAKAEAEEKAKTEAEEKAKAEAEENARAEAEAKAKAEAEAKAKAEAEENARAEAEAKAKAEAEAKAKAEAEAKAKAEAEAKAKAEAEAKARAAERAAQAPIDIMGTSTMPSVLPPGQDMGSREPARVSEPAAVPVEPAKEVPKETPQQAETPEPVVETPVESPVAAAEGEKAVGENRPRKKRSVPVGALVVLLLLAAVVVGAVMFVPKLLKSPDGPTGVQGTVNRELREKQYLEGGWEKDAREVLGRFLAAERSAGKAAYSIRGSELLEEMDDFYDGLRIDDSDTPEEAFAVFPLLMADKQRGIFMLTYDQPPVFELDEFFVPLSPLAVQHGVEDPGLLLATVARRSNFTAEPLKVHALFKRTPDGLRVDWETFVQTKYRTMRDFLELPAAGTRKVFRVIIAETVPENRRVPAGYRTYMIADPAYPKEDSARVNVAVDSEIGQALSILNWRGTKEGRATSKTATIELGWSHEATPQLEVTKFICWEFLGVGGEAIPSAR
ncbi:hypothetical protein JIN81_15230 [Haloferula rosea]|uniref:Uncharacterized protein n=1 Tax=Haloferula rosea TaxID=490093 RepID=A0A934RD53_9BACT|nr:hypothetical protein [Haloferula rosea]